MNIYEKIQNVKVELLNSNLKKSGENKFSGFKYFELADFLPTLIKLCDKAKLFTAISFNNELATLTIVNAEAPEEIVTYTSPMKDLELKGCNSVQALGGTETYSRRYLYLAAFDITEADMFDANAGSDRNQEVINNTKAQALEKSISNKNISADKVNAVLSKFGYKAISDISIADYKKVCDELQKEA